MTSSHAGSTLSNERLARMVSRFAVAAGAHRLAMEAMDDNRAACHVKVLSGLYAAIIREGECGAGAFLALLDDRDDAVAGMAAVFALGISTERSLAVLQRLAGLEGLLGFRARCALERWEKGEWQQP
jgi:hypothetical protein